MPTRASSPTESRSGRLRATDDERAHGAAIAERDRSAAHCSSAALDAGPPCRPLWDLTPPGGASSRVVPPTPSTVRTAFASELIPPPPPLSSLRSRDALSPRPATRSATPSSSRSRTPRPSTGGGRRSGSRLRTANAGGGSGDGGFVVAVVEGRGVTGWVGLAALNLTTSECIVSQFADTQTYVKTLHKLSIYAPAEIVVSSTIVDPVKSKLYELLEEALPDGVVVPVARKYFSDNAGLGYLKQYSLESELAGLMVGITSKHYCLAAAAAVLKYVECSQDVLFCANSIRFRYQACDGTMMIDAVTVKNLELVANLTNPHSGLSLYGTLNHTCTSMGARLLRTNILQPLTDASTIERRLDAVEELTQNEESFFSTQHALKAFPDLDHLITSIIRISKKPSVKQAAQNITNVIMLKHVLQMLHPLRAALVGRQSELLQAIYQLLSEAKLDQMLNRIGTTLNEDVTWTKSAIALRNQRCYAIKAGYNGLLDVARQTYKETVDDIYELVSSYAERYQIPVKLNFNATTGFMLSCTTDALLASGGNLPLVFINVVKKRKLLAFTTLELMKLNDRCNESLVEVYLISDKTVGELIDAIRNDVGVLYKASESVGMLDMLVSFAHRCTISNYVRPEFSPDTLAVKSGAHPIRQELSEDTFVPNDCYASEGTNFQVVTGPNLSGKSTYLRQIALLAVMSQIGSFVPAEFATFRIVDRLFGRIGCDDNIEAAASTFTAEMREAAYILQNVTSQSLVIIDELGRGTSTYDGLGITFAICEQLVKTKVTVYGSECYATNGVMLTI